MGLAHLTKKSTFQLGRAQMTSVKELNRDYHLCNDMEDSVVCKGTASSIYSTKSFYKEVMQISGNNNEI